MIRSQIIKINSRLQRITLMPILLMGYLEKDSSMMLKQLRGISKRDLIVPHLEKSMGILIQLMHLRIKNRKQ